MLNFIFSQILFYISLGVVLLIPGYALLLATKQHKSFSSLELFVLASGSSIAAVDLLMILLGKSGFQITQLSILTVITLFVIVCGVTYLFHRKKAVSLGLLQSSLAENMSKRSTFLVITLLFLTIFIKTTYFKDTIFPTSTDLGHHMYWAKDITTTGHLPIYEKADIGPTLNIEKPAPIADFIIGEHLIFAAIALLSGVDFISAFPALVLFFIHLMSILAIFILVRSIFKRSPNRDNIAIMALLLIGPLYSLASPQAKFVSGGVIGNTIGNLFIPLAIFLFLKALDEKKSSILAYALFISLGMAYTHHLSTFVFIFIFIFTIAAFVALNHKTALSSVRRWLKLSIAPSVLLTFAIGVIFVLFLYTPTYLNPSAIDTAVGAPSKATRTGLTLTQLKLTAGEARMALALVGIIVLLFMRSLGKYPQAFLIGWTFSLTIMSLRPDWLLIDIPSNRVASYIVFPIAIVAAFMLVTLLSSLKADNRSSNRLSPALTLVTFFLLLTFVATGGFYDDAQSLNTQSSTKNALQTHLASQYLANRTDNSDIILKDHNYLAGDSWMKLFFMRGYNYPLSRGYFKRYEDETKNREQCTNLMISQPAGDDAQKCFAGTGTDFIVVDPKMDSAQFHRLKNFSQVYVNDDISIFHKNNEQ